MAEIHYIKENLKKKLHFILWNEEYIKKIEKETIEWLYRNQYEYEEQIPTIEYDTEPTCDSDDIYGVYKVYCYKGVHTKYMCRMFVIE